MTALEDLVRNIDVTDPYPVWQSLLERGPIIAPDGSFLAPDELARRFAEHGITDALDVVVYCGSGVTACHDLIALEHAGLGRARLYPGSWSQYAATDRPIATGPEPGSHPGVDALGRNL